MSGSNNVVLKNAGIHSFTNILSDVPQGSMQEAVNVVIDRNQVVEPRRGYAKYGNTFGIPSVDLTQQLLQYKDTVLRHVLSSLQFDSDLNGDFRTISSNGDVKEAGFGTRLKYLEANGNLYLATSEGIKKISAKNRVDLLSASVTEAGGAKALDVNVMLNFTSPGFLEPNSKVSYRIVFGYKDENENLILGSPSAPTQVYNNTANSCYTTLSFALPLGVTDKYIYQVYRTGLSISDIVGVEPNDPGDEMNLVFEENITAMNIANGFIQNVDDITPESFRKSGTLLYTNPVSGEGIAQANEKPPFAIDIANYKGYTFYANTASVQRLNLSYITINNFVSGMDTLTITDDNGISTIYTYRGTNETFTANFTGVNTRVLFKTNITSAGVYFTIASANIERKYYVWYYSTERDLDPGLTDVNISGYSGIKVTINSTETAIASSTGTTVTLATAPMKPVKVGDVFVFGNQSATVTTVNTPTSFVVNTAFTPNLSANEITIISVDNLSTILQKTVDAIMLTSDDFNATVAPMMSSVVIACANNGYVTANIPSYVMSPFVAKDTITLGNVLVTANGAGSGEDPANNFIFLPRVPVVPTENAPTVSQQLEQIAKSTVRVINQQDPLISAYYQSTYQSVPGQMLFEGDAVTGPVFYVLSSKGANFTPTVSMSLPTTVPVKSTNEIRPNRIMYSKFQQPEAVPLANFIDIGPKDRAVNRIVPLRDSLFILKEDGIYRLSGDVAPFTVAPFDFSVQVLAPDTAVVLNNQIYALSTQGVIVITDTGVSVISRPIEDKILRVLTEDSFYKTVSFGVSYESDRAYHLFLPTLKTDTIATQSFRYNTFTNTWTRADKSATCGVVNFGDNTMYLGAGDLNFIEKERKSLSRTDYADREYAHSVVLDGVMGTEVEIDNVLNLKVGDVFYQKQYVNVAQFNRLLTKLDDDSGLSQNDYLSTLKISAGKNLRNSLASLADKLDMDTGLTFKGYAALIADYNQTATNIEILPSGFTKITFMSNKIKTGRVVTILGSDTFPSLYLNYKVIDSDDFSITINQKLTLINSTSATVTTAELLSEDQQGCYNLITNRLNVDLGASYTNYPVINQTTELEATVIEFSKITRKITIDKPQDFLFGDCITYSAINSTIIYNPQFFGDVSLDKQVREGTAIFENDNFSRFSVGYSTDKFPSFIDTTFTTPGIGDFGQFYFGGINFGGVAAPVPLRTYVPLEKQRCRFINVKLQHSTAREKYSLYGFSLVFRPYNTRTNK